MSRSLLQSAFDQLLQKLLDARVLGSRELGNRPAANARILVAFGDGEQLVDGNPVTALRVKTDERVLHLWIGGRVVQPHEFSDRYAGARRVGQRAPTRCDGRALVTRNAKEPSGILGAADVGEGGQHGLTRMIARELGIHLTQQVSVATGRVLRTKSSNG